MAGLYVTRFAGKILSSKLVEHKKIRKITKLMGQLSNILWSRVIMALDSSEMITMFGCPYKAINSM